MAVAVLHHVMQCAGQKKHVTVSPELVACLLHVHDTALGGMLHHKTFASCCWVQRGHLLVAESSEDIQLCVLGECCTLLRTLNCVYWECIALHCRSCCAAAPQDRPQRTSKLAPLLTCTLCITSVRVRPAATP